MTPILKDHQPNAKGQAMMEGKATAEEQAAKSALGGRTKSIRRKLRRGRPDESGLTTLEWLLIVAAVAGLAALAVVLVQNVVDETAQDISGSSARLTAAKVAAASVVEQAKNADSSEPRFNTWAKWDNYFTDKCNRIKITYSDAGLDDVVPEFARATGATDPPDTTLLQAGADAAGTAAAQTKCVVTP